MISEIKIKNNPYNIDLNSLIVMGKRANNPKRNFLFISKVLGKHLEVKPNICRAIGFLLSETVYGKNANEIINLIKYINNPNEDIKINNEMNIGFTTEENILVLGFAETATGLGMAVASAIKDSYYITTTREDITNIKPLIDFEEEHSHATNHKAFPIDRDRIMNSERIIIVDDEITTGNSMMNIIRDLKRTTGISKYTVLSILDWRSDENISKFKLLAEELDIEINVSSLISGSVEFKDTTMYVDNNEIEISEKVEQIELNFLERVNMVCGKENISYLKNSGRFGVQYDEILNLEDYSKEIAKKVQAIIGEKEKVLILGHGESIYIPSRIASKLKGDVEFKSTTRSPIYCSEEEDNPIKTKHFFYHKGVKYYFYNKDYIEKKYDAVVLLSEDDFNIKLCENIVIIKL